MYNRQIVKGGFVIVALVVPLTESKETRSNLSEWGTVRGMKNDYGDQSVLTRTVWQANTNGSLLAKLRYYSAHRLRTRKGATFARTVNDYSYAAADSTFFLLLLRFAGRPPNP
jgi:hypothetical protein